MDIIKEINEKYSTLEAEVDKKLHQVKQEEEKLEKLNYGTIENSPKKANKVLSYAEAMKRNTNLIKTLEIAKARLRSRSTFSPVEQILEKSIENYKRDVLSSSAHLTVTKSFVNAQQSANVPEKIINNKNNVYDDLISSGGK